MSLRGDIKRLTDYKVMPSLSADIWGENGKSLFGVLLYYIDIDFVMHEKVCFAVSACRFCLVRFDRLVDVHM